MWRRMKYALMVVAASGAAMGATAALPSTASATYSSHCWAYVGGNRSTGGCTGSPYGGTDFMVTEVCHYWAWSWTVSSPVTYAPPNRAVNATTGACWAGGAVQAFISLND
jgi:hypothetical protein